jgi:hypothetical protein
MSRLRASVVLVTLVAGCGGRQSLDEGGDGASAVTSGQCGHDPTVGTGQPGSCGAARAALDCEFPNGAGCVCVSDGTTCEGCAATCTNKCDANEYAASCGGIGPSGPSADPPAACRLVLPTPGGIAFYCCPCL